MRSDLLDLRPDNEARLLVLIDGFSGRDLNQGIAGRTKLAKLDFLLRYPNFLKRLTEARGVDADPGEDPWLTGAVERSMIRYRFGPWDPAYFSLLGGLVGKGLIRVENTARGRNYTATESGRAAAAQLRKEDSWLVVAERVRFLKRHFDLGGRTLMELLYANFPEISGAEWGEKL